MITIRDTKTEEFSRPMTRVEKVMWKCGFWFGAIVASIFWVIVIAIF